MVFEWCQRITDIREQFPLRQEDTIEIADRLGITHPRVPGTEDLTVMTTDFILDVLVEGRIVMVARAVKLSQDLNDFRVIEKLEIERTYWRDRKIDWGIITPDRDFPKNLASNVGWVHKAYYSDDAPCRLTEKIIRQAEEALYQQMAVHNTTPLSHVALALDERFGLPGGTCLWIVRHLIATQTWSVDMKQKLTPDLPLKVVERAVFRLEAVDA
ncbi:TnsA endonuclease N-terminal domain-containing protein [Geomonas agri]|uniref:TnsA endonuclease N-terminal domain-containing protein n=1 Tax=Geomonas agri TaxID=2873702 RepID=UPI001CD394DC|nr:TnsA endonuclease N-terminal domain-containing protein [Geomonas agri]